MPNVRVGCCLGPEGNGVSSGEEGEGGPDPPSKDGEKQSTPNKEGATWSRKKKNGRVGRDEEEPGYASSV